MKINRYNRSCIGLMEMDKDGAWCKFDEADIEYQSIKEYSERMQQGYLRQVKVTAKLIWYNNFYRRKRSLLFLLVSISLLTNLWMFIK